MGGDGIWDFCAAAKHGIALVKSRDWGRHEVVDKHFNWFLDRLDKRSVSLAGRSGVSRMSAWFLVPCLILLAVVWYIVFEVCFRGVQ